MLVLTRKVGEKIKIGDNVTISVLAVHGRRVQIGIEAPAEIPIHRQEIYVKIAADSAAELPPGREAEVRVPENSVSE